MQARSIFVECPESCLRERETLQEFCDGVHAVGGEEKVVEDEAAFGSPNELDAFVRSRLHKSEMTVARFHNREAVLLCQEVDFAGSRDRYGDFPNFRVSEDDKLGHQSQQAVAVDVMALLIDDNNLFRTRVEH